jgi:acyl dehydratase
VPGRWFEEFQVGQSIRHAAQVEVTMEDNVAFCRLTRNNQPLHLDEAYARRTPFGRIVVNGLYTLSVAVGVSVEDTTAGTIVANLGYDQVEHPKPVFPGDRLGFLTEVVEKRPSSKPGRGIVTLLHRVHNQHGDEVCRFRRTVMVQAKEAAA